MSLLMEALKKAEEEKKRAAKQLKEVEEPAREANTLSEDDTLDKMETPASGTAIERKKKPASDHLELTLAPLESKEMGEAEERVLTKEEERVLGSTHEELEVSRELLDEARQKQKAFEKSFSEELTIETLDEEKPARDESLENTIEAPDDQLDLDDSAIIEGLLPGDKPASPSFDDTFHGVVFDDDEGSNYEETLPGVTAEQLSRDLGGGVYQPTPVAAKTVFNAGRTSRKKSSFKWGIFSLLLLLAIGSFAIFYYYSITPVARKMPPPDVARGIESTPAAIPRVPPVENDSVSGTLIAREPEVTATVPAGEQATASEAATAEAVQAAVAVAEPAVAETSATVATIESTEPETRFPVAAVAATVTADTAPVQQTVKSMDEAPLPGRLPEAIARDREAMSIRTQSANNSEAVLVRQGFEAYRGGNLGLAKSLYQDVLAINADNRDAHLGLAAIAISLNDMQMAFGHYSQLLKVNPDDVTAMTALQSLNKNLDPVKGESAIKLMLQKEADNPYLYFNLGNLYARQQRWPEAQQAFFDAYRLDNTNAAYALNLAVSLDYMEQYAAAINYYQSALDLAEANSGGASLDTADILQRINSLLPVVQK